MADSELERLRAEVRSRRAAATRKAARVKRQTMARVAGSEFDPRRAPGAELKMNKAQLKAYARRLDSFVDRKTQFVSLAGGKPVPREKWNNFLRVQKRFNATRDWHARNIENVSIRGRDTIREKRSLIKDQAFPSQSLFGRSKLDDPSRISSVKRLEELTNKLESRTSPSAFKRDVAAARKHLMTMADLSGDGGQLSERFRTMTADQISAFHSDAQFMDALSLTMVYPEGSKPTEVNDNMYRQVDNFVTDIRSTF